MRRRWVPSRARLPPGARRPGPVRPRRLRAPRTATSHLQHLAHTSGVGRLPSNTDSASQTAISLIAVRRANKVPQMAAPLQRHAARHPKKAPPSYARPPAKRENATNQNGLPSMSAQPSACVRLPRRRPGAHALSARATDSVRVVAAPGRPLGRRLVVVHLGDLL